MKEKRVYLLMMLIFIVAICVFAVVWHHGKILKEEAHQKAMDFYYGEEGLFSVEENGVTYFYKRDDEGNPHFIRYELDVTPAPSYETVGNTVLITVQQHNS